MMKPWQRYEWRHTLACSLAVIAASLCAAYFDFANMFWAVFAAVVVVQTSRGTPVHQGLSALFMVLIGVIAGYGLSQNLEMAEMISVSQLMLLMGSVMLMLRLPASYQKILEWVVPSIALLAAVVWPAADEMQLAQRLMMLMLGGVLGMSCNILVLSMQPYAEFRQGMLPILQALIDYSSAVTMHVLKEEKNTQAMDQAVNRLERVLRSHRNEYPEWVFEAGFNRNLRSSFRYVLIQMERITESFFSLDYHVRQTMEPEMLADFAPHLSLVCTRNAELLQVMRGFFAGERITLNQENFTSDITDVHNSLRNLLPGSLELLDMSPDYVNIAALARDVIDIRELLLQLLAGLPIDELAVTE